VTYPQERKARLRQQQYETRQAELAAREERSVQIDKHLQQVAEAQKKQQQVQLWFIIMFIIIRYK